MAETSEVMGVPVVELIIGGLILLIMLFALPLLAKVFYNPEPCLNKGDWISLKTDLEAIDKGLITKRENIPFNNEGCVLLSYQPEKTYEYSYMTIPAHVVGEKAAVCLCKPKEEKGKLTGSCETPGDAECYFFKNIKEINNKRQFTTLHDQGKQLFLSLHKEGKVVTITNQFGAGEFSLSPEVRKKYEDNLQLSKQHITNDICIEKINQVGQSESTRLYTVKQQSDALIKTDQGPEEDNLGKCIIYHVLAEGNKNQEQLFCHADACGVNKCYMATVNADPKGTKQIEACKTCPTVYDCSIYTNPFECAYDPCFKTATCIWVQGKCVYDPTREKHE